MANGKQLTELLGSYIIGKRFLKIKMLVIIAIILFVAILIIYG
jgi:hypothetical protein